ncbi:hypothetical protein F4677DRAFT_450424 [Hypoxylon crocopeplum]|nr:hypothetical protein F4677DRAFT_450424 [Hypoxylon crocopeplum]
MYAITVLIPFLEAVDVISSPSLPLGAIIGIMMILLLSFVAGGHNDHNPYLQSAALIVNAVSVKAVTSAGLPQQVYGIALWGACRVSWGPMRPAAYVVATTLAAHNFIVGNGGFFLLDLALLLASDDAILCQTATIAASVWASRGLGGSLTKHNPTAAYDEHDIALELHTIIENPSDSVTSSEFSGPEYSDSLTPFYSPEPSADVESIFGLNSPSTESLTNESQAQEPSINEYPNNGTPTDSVYPGEEYLYSTEAPNSIETLYSTEAPNSIKALSYNEATFHADPPTPIEATSDTTTPHVEYSPPDTKPLNEELSRDSKLLEENIDLDAKPTLATEMDVDDIEYTLPISMDLDEEEQTLPTDMVINDTEDRDAQVSNYTSMVPPTNTDLPVQDADIEAPTTSVERDDDSDSSMADVAPVDTESQETVPASLNTPRSHIVMNQMSEAEAQRLGIKLP